MFLYCKLFNKKKQMMNMMICSCWGAIRCLFESKAESMAECGAYFTVVHFHGVVYFTIFAKTQVARVNA